MMRSRLLVVLLMFLCLILSMQMAVAAEENETESYPSGLGFSKWVAKQFVMNSATFQFDGVWKTLELTDTTTLDCSNCWEFHYEFDCSHAGYGDRSDEIVATVITHHKARIVVEQFWVTKAILDDQWDMINQKMLVDDPQDPVDDLPIDDDPPTEEEIGTQVQGNNDFAFELYQQLISEEDNLFYSPYSISLALAMAYAGAEGETETQMADAL
ncbi:MAG: serpin family protein, partial [Desulfobacteraceae bacterium]